MLPNASKWWMSHRVLNSRLARWSLQLQTFTFDIEHRKGAQSVIPDTLSRYDIEEVLIEIKSLIDLDSSAFKSDEYAELIANTERNSSQLPDFKVIDAMCACISLISLRFSMVAVILN